MNISSKENGVQANKNIEEEMLNMAMQQSMSQFPKEIINTQEVVDEDAELLKQILE